MTRYAVTRDYNFYPIGDDEPYLPTVACLDVRTVKQGKEWQSCHIFQLPAAEQLLLRIKSGKVKGNRTISLVFDREQDQYLYIADAAEFADRFISQLEEIIAL